MLVDQKPLCCIQSVLVAEGLMGRGNGHNVLSECHAYFHNLLPCVMGSFLSVHLVVKDHSEARNISQPPLTGRDVNDQPVSFWKQPLLLQDVYNDWQSQVVWSKRLIQSHSIPLPATAINHIRL